MEPTRSQLAGSAGWVKGAKRDRSHAQRSEHGEDPLFDPPEHPATIASGWDESSRLRTSTSDGLYGMRKAEEESPAKRPHRLTLALDTQHGIYREHLFR